ncbi:MAG: hypothetical protein HOC91_09940 [Nitrospinaceae bacterium]|jgi:hypothetical protein|nr:hypothetical protein [Nitrospinaceae bacterium]MBT3432861.1 hypothetical protein [Nitrospinaceae bacterium]MBT4095299.1 hypothetical protein [Nitrospinaceae bacterium]MBT4430822.1 hypothetical protein [Nitrospinaceae bacterium]MBT5367097.1 hypothetical protein [Nitrospinaceae bacterium]
MIIRIIIYALIFYAIFYALKGLFGSMSRQMEGSGAGDDVADDEMLICPECGSYFPTSISVPKRVRRERLLFCGEECAKIYGDRGGPQEESE